MLLTFIIELRADFPLHLLHSRASYLLVGLWSLTAIIFANYYSATLFSFLSVGKLERNINSLAELATSNQYQLVTQAKSLWIYAIRDYAKSENEKIIYKSLLDDPSNMIATIEEAEAKLMTGKYAFAYVMWFNLLSLEMI